MEQTLFKRKSILFRLLIPPYFFPYKHPARKKYATLRTSFIQATHFQCCHNNLKSVFFKEIEVEQMFTTYWIVITWRLDWGGTWHVELGLIILVTMLLGLLILWLVKVKIKYFWFDTCVHNWSVTWLCGWGSLILSQHPVKFGVHRPCESGDITLLICHVTTISKCHMTL